MRPDIVNLRQFYSSRLGRRVKARLRRVMRHHWPLPQGSLLGLGYAIPMESRHSRSNGKGDLTLALMPLEQGGIYWPVDDKNRTVLCDLMRPPIGPNTVPRAVAMHIFEHTENPEEFLRILWQLLMPGGRLLLVVPNRRGLWAHWGSTPFTTGTAYTLSGMKALLNAADFTLREVSSALYPPPSAHPFWLHLWPILEWFGSVLLPRSGGVLIIEAEKQIYAAIGDRARKPATTAAWKPATAQI